MSSQSRTVWAGLGVSAICIMMASLKGQHLLMFIAMSFVSWAVWWFKAANRINSPVVKQEPRRTSRRGRSTTRENVYKFPGAHLSVSDAAGS